MFGGNAAVRPFLGINTSVGGKVFGPYRIGEPIAAGGMGLIYHALDTMLDRVVAVKVLPPWEMGNPRSRQQLREEARLASTLHHPSIVTIYGLHELEHFDLIIMEYVPGEQLGLSIRPRGLPTPMVLRYALQLADALALVHARGILHRDLKPSNVIAGTGGRITLIDFGLAARLGRLESSCSRHGSAMWLAPEEQYDRPAIPDPRSEIFSFGLVLHNMLSGRHPFGPGSPEELAAAIQHRLPAGLPGRVPKRVSEIVRRCLAKEPRQRFDSMASVVRALGACCQTSGVQVFPFSARRFARGR
jgi:serine/threonine-protein kinase